MSDVYKCPLCGEETPRDLEIFLNHANEHVIDQIKKDHPEWQEEDGSCAKCIEYFRKQMRGE